MNWVSLAAHFNMKWGHLATDSWVKVLRKKFSTLQLDLRLDYKEIPKPRERDACIMELLMLQGWSGKEQAEANCVRKYQEAMFLSCITNAGGTKIEPSYLHETGNKPRSMNMISTDPLAPSAQNIPQS